jgi:predicted amidohydrolase
MRKNIRAGAVQFESLPGNKKANFEKINRFCELAAHRDVEILIFPECCITGYWFLRKKTKKNLKDLAEHVFDGYSSRFLIAIAKNFNMMIGAGLIEIDDSNNLYNTYVVAFPDGKVYKHRKLHCFVSEFMNSGSEFTIFNSPYEVKMGILTCYDNNIGENVRITAMKGAQILLAPHQTGGCASPDPNALGSIDRSLWKNRHKNRKLIENEISGPKGREWILRWLPARAHDNGIFILFSNGVGIDDNEVRTGNAMIIDPYGRIIKETGKADDDIVIADLDLSLLKENTGQRWIKTRRPELYKSLTSLTGKERSTREIRFDGKGV